MGIINLQLKFSKIGVNSLNQPRKMCYMPIAVIQFENQSKKKRIQLEDIIYDKESVKYVIFGETYIAILINEDFSIYNLEGRKQGSVNNSNYGELIQVNEDSFILCKDRVVTWINDKGEIVKSRELTDEEYQSLQDEENK